MCYKSFLCQRDGLENRTTARGHRKDKPMLDKAGEAGNKETSEDAQTLGRAKSSISGVQSTCSPSPDALALHPHYQLKVSPIYTRVFLRTGLHQTFTPSSPGNLCLPCSKCKCRCLCVSGPPQSISIYKRTFDTHIITDLTVDRSPSN